MPPGTSPGYNDPSTIALSKKPARAADLKVVLLGESSVGKSSILQRFQSNTFNENKSSTIGAAFISKKVFKTNPNNEDCSLINLQIWDTAGQERFHNLTPLYYRNANLALIVFDLNDEQSFKKAEFWTKELNIYKSDNFDSKMRILLVGNKLDLLKENEEGTRFKECTFIDQVEIFVNENKDINNFFKTSARSNIGLTELFSHIIDNVDDSLFQPFGEENNAKSKKGLIDLRLRSQPDEFGNSTCQC